MKKLVLFAIITFISVNLIGQVWSGSTTIDGNIYRNRNVGIGLSYPKSALDVNGTVTLTKNGVSVNSIVPNANINGLERTMRFSYSSNNMNEGFQFYNDYTEKNLMFISGNGNVGIGTVNPSYKLDILETENNGVKIQAGNQASDIAFSVGSPSQADKFIIQAGGNVGIGTTNPSYKLDILTDNNGIKIRAGSVGNDIAFSVGSPSQADKFIIQAGGNVGIGTTTPNYKLDVKGTIRSEEVIVETSWSDFVFEPTYPLISLEDLEQYIKQNKHLPDVPSAEEVKENGLSLGQSDAILLQKIEELTLYVIEQNKTLKAQNERLNKVEAENEGLIKAKAENSELKKLNAKLLKLEEKFEKLESNKN